jgi:hypothetical protein
MKKIELKFSQQDWMEIYYALLTKTVHIGRGDYTFFGGTESGRERWVEQLMGIAKVISKKVRV